jgi:choline kinase
MQAIILAAGLSKRLRPLTDSTPKCLLKIGAKTILEMTIDNVLRNDINDFVMVTGFRENMIKDYIMKKYPGLDIQYLTNPDYENNNNSYSLWMAKEKVSGDCILLDSDILFDYQIVSKLLHSENENYLAVNTKHKLGEEEIKVIVDSSNKIIHIGKDVNPLKSYGESIGIERFSANFFKKLGKVLDRKVVAENNVNEFYEASFQELIDSGNGIFAVNVSEYTSMEIDTIEDFERANLIVNW